MFSSLKISKQHNVKKKPPQSIHKIKCSHPTDYFSENGISVEENIVMKETSFYNKLI